MPEPTKVAPSVLPPPPRPAGTRLTLDAIFPKAMTSLGTGSAAIDVDFEGADQVVGVASKRLGKGPFILTGFGQYQWKNKDFTWGARLSARWK